MTETDVEIILQRGLEKYLPAKFRISDIGPQFIAGVSTSPSGLPV